MADGLPVPAPPAPPKLGSHIETGYFPQNYERAVVVAVLPDEPAPGEWVVVVRSWWKRKRRYHYRALRWIELHTGLWRPSPRARTWPELAAAAARGGA